MSYTGCMVGIRVALCVHTRGDGLFYLLTSGTQSVGRCDIDASSVMPQAPAQRASPAL